MAAVRKNVMLSFGIVQLPVSVETAVDDDDKDTRLHTLCTGHPPFKSAHPAARVRFALTCPACQNEDKTSFVKGSEVGGAYAIVSETALAELAVDEELKNSIKLTTHPAEQVSKSTLPGGKVYYLNPAKTSASQYALIANLVASRPDLAFCTMWAARSKASMYRLGVQDNALTLEMIAWPENLRTAPQVEGTIDTKMAKLVGALADGLCADFDPATYRNTRTETLKAIIEAADKVEAADTPPAVTTVAKAPAGGVDLMAALAAEVAKLRSVPASKTVRKAAPAKRTTTTKAAPAAAKAATRTQRKPAAAKLAKAS